MSKVFWIVAPTAAVALASGIVASAGCARTANDCALIGGCTGGAPTTSSTGGGATTASSASTSSASGGGSLNDGGTTDAADGATNDGATDDASTNDGGDGAASDASSCTQVAKRWGDATDQIARGFSLTASGGSVIAGDFQGQFSFGGPTINAPSSSLVVAMIDPTASFKPVTASATFLASTVDASGAIVFAGTYSAGDAAAGMDFGCGPLDATKRSFVARMDAQNKCLFLHAFAARPDRASLAVDASGNVVFAGGVRGVADFGGSNPPTAQSEDVFVVSLKSDGTYLWDNTFGGPNDDEASGVAVSADGKLVAVTGTFSGKIDFGSGQSALDSGTTADVFVAAFSASGTTAWATSFIGASNESAAGIVAVPSGVIVGGSYPSSLAIGKASFTAGGGFAAKLDPAGAPVWAHSFDGMPVSALAAGASEATVYAGTAGSNLLLAGLDKDGASSFVTDKVVGTGSAPIIAGVGILGSGVAVAGSFDATLGALSSAGGKDVFYLVRCP